MLASLHLVPVVAAHLRTRVKTVGTYREIWYRETHGKDFGGRLLDCRRHPRALYGRVDVDTWTWFSRGLSPAVCPFPTSLVDSDTCRDSLSRGICLSVQTQTSQDKSKPKVCELTPIADSATSRGPA